MKKIDSNQAAGKRGWKQLGKVEKQLGKVDRSLLVFKGEVVDRFQSLEDKIDKSEGRVVGLLGEVMIELKDLRQREN